MFDATLLISGRQAAMCGRHRDQQKYNKRQINRLQERTGGFTLVELMIVVAIISILVAVALPAYRDYSVRTRVSEGMVLVGAAKQTVNDSASTLVDLASGANTWNTGAGGLGATSKYVTSILINPANGEVTITFNPVNVGVGGTIIMTPYVQTGTGVPVQLGAALATNQTGAIDWGCASTTNLVSVGRNLTATLGTLPSRFASSECS